MNEGKIVSLLRYPERRKPSVEEDALVVRENFGIEGDCHADGGDRQISLLTVEEKEWMKAQEIQGFCFRKYKENLLLAGISLQECRRGELLVCDEVVLEVSGSMKGCHLELCDLAASDQKCILAGGSKFAKVKKGGILKKGAKVSVVHCKNYSLNLEET